MSSGEDARLPNVGHFLKRVAVALMLCVGVPVAAVLVLVYWPASWSPNLSIRLGSELPTDSKVSGTVLLQKGFDRVCHELTTDRAIKAQLEADLRFYRSYDLVGRRYDRARVLFFVGKQGVRYATFGQLSVQPVDFDRPIKDDESGCWPLHLVMFEVQPASRYRAAPGKSRRRYENVEDIYVWMWIDNRSQ